jgi:hypothetical protein
VNGAPGEQRTRWGRGGRRRRSERLAAWRHRWNARLVRFAAAEVLAGALIVTTWSVLAGVGVGPLLVVAILMAAGLWLHLASVETGNHTLLWMTSAWLLVLMIVAAESTLGGLSPLSYSIASFTVFGHNELVRLNYARRRGAEIDEEVYVASAIGVGTAGLVAVIGIGVAQPLAEGGDRSWLWMPAAAVVLIGVGSLLTLLPARRAPRASRQRWRPGDRIPPQPLGQDSSGSNRRGPGAMLGPGARRR